MIDALKLLDPRPEPVASRMMGFGAFASLMEGVDTALAQAAEDAPEPITVQEAKDHLRVVIPDEDDYIAALITAAREMAEGRLNRTIRRRQRTTTFGGWGAVMALLKPPVVSVDSISYTDPDGTTHPLPADAFYADAQDDSAALVELLPGYQLPELHKRRRPIVVTYTAGYAEGEVPGAIRQWMLLAIGTMYNNRESIINGVSSQALADGFMQMLIQQYMVYE